MVDPWGLQAGLAPGTKLLNFMPPNAGKAYIEGQVVVLGANFMNLEAMRLRASERFTDFMLEQFVSVALGYLSVQTQVGVPGSGSSVNDEPSAEQPGEGEPDRPFGRGNYGSQTQHEEKNLRKRSSIVYFALYYLKVGEKDAKNYRKDSDYKNLEGAPKCNIFVYDMLFFAGINIGSEHVKARKWHLFKSLPPGTKEWGNPNYKIPGFITVSKPQAGDVVVVRGTSVGHVAIMVSETESIYTNGEIIMRSDFGSNPIWITPGDKNYWPGNNGYVYWRYIGE